MVPEPPPEPGPRDRLVSVGLFLVTLLCVYWVYGSAWVGGDPFTEPDTARQAARFAGGLMAVLLAHEMGHYLVARAHGFALSLPFFIPLPTAFGTLGAIIRLKSLPRDRTGLLEMGAAGPLAGFVVVLGLLALGLPGTEDPGCIELVLPPGAELPALAAPAPAPPGPFWQAVEALLSRPPLSWVIPAPPGPDEVQVMILANPPVMDLLGWLLLGAAPGRYAQLDPLAMAAWVGCLITAINLAPVGQLDGGHVFNALRPDLATRVSRLGIAVAFVGALVWLGWAFWGLLLLVIQAWRPLPVPLYPPPSRRARRIAALVAATFLLCFMPRPLQPENVPLSMVCFVTAEGAPALPPDPG